MMNIEQTIEYMKAAHAGQTDAGGFPYETHPIRVRERVLALMAEYKLSFDQDEQLAIEQAALLHDVLEDTEISIHDLLKAGFSERTVALVMGLSRPTGKNRPTYMQWITSISESGDVGLILIKMADNQDNNDPDRIAQLPEEKRSITKRYERAWWELKRGLLVDNIILRKA